MSDELNKLNIELVDYCKSNGIVANEDIFNIAVKFGRHLEKHNLTNVRLDYFSKIDEVRNIDDEILNIRHKLNAVAKHIVTKAIAEQIESEGDWEIGYGSYYRNYGKLNEEISVKHCLQISSVDQPERHGDFEVRFALTGKLEECFKSRGYSPQILVFVQNSSGDDSECIRDITEINNTLYHIGIEVYCKRDEESRKQLADLLHAFSKDYLFEMLKD